MAVKQFKTSTREITDEDRIEFNIDKDKFVAIRPKESAWVLLAAGGEEGGLASLAAVGRFMDQVLDPASAKRFSKRLTDPRDGLDYDVAMDIFKWLLEEFTGRPTESLRD